MPDQHLALVTRARLHSAESAVALNRRPHAVAEHVAGCVHMLCVGHLAGGRFEAHPPHPTGAPAAT